MEDKNKTFENDIIIGRNAVREALSGGRPADRLLVAKGAGGSVTQLVAMCREKGSLSRKPIRKNSTRSAAAGGTRA